MMVVFVTFVVMTMIMMKMMATTDFAVTAVVDRQLWLQIIEQRLIL
ncbi:MAG: hypothetical protein M3261_04330 [Thermoproteota archaeon]|nr:hypothetical protein [Thermoproteota archaeon]